MTNKRFFAKDIKDGGKSKEKMLNRIGAYKNP